MCNSPLCPGCDDCTTGRAAAGWLCDLQHEAAAIGLTIPDDAIVICETGYWFEVHGDRFERGDNVARAVEMLADGHSGCHHDERWFDVPRALALAVWWMEHYGEGDPLYAISEPHKHAAAYLSAVWDQQSREAYSERLEQAS